ncbi:MAG: hypothetical protein RLZ44_806 [Pseudomonadota bacterium]|jgi:hypothetical protein
MVAARFPRFLSAAVPLAAIAWAVPAQAAPGPFPACLDYHCDRQQQVTLSTASWQEIRRLFAPLRDAAGERAAIRQAIARLEQDVGRLTGTWRDLGENAAGAGLPGQLDCIAESRNTTTYLRLLADDGLLRWHEVGERVRRQRWIFAIHWTAVIRDLADGSEYAVDSWPLDNGQPPYMQPLEAWRRGAAFDAG